jgi:membrane protein required for colicin V production
MILDIIIVIVLIISAAIAFFRGFIKEVLTILGVGGAAGGAFLFGGKVVGIFQGWLGHEDDPDYKYFGLIPPDILAMVLGYVAVFVLIFVILTVLSHFVSKGAQAMGLGPIDRSLGIVFGIARGILLLGILYLPFLLVMPEDDFPDFVKESRLIPVVDAVVDWTIETADIKEPLEDITPDENNIKDSIDAIDKVREGYISPEGKGKDQPENDEPGYEKQDRRALEKLIEDDALNE